MPHTHHAANEARGSSLAQTLCKPLAGALYRPLAQSLADQIAEAVRNRATPLSQLLRLMSALDAQGGDDELRLLLRARIGAPLEA